MTFDDVSDIYGLFATFEGQEPVKLISIELYIQKHLSSRYRYKIGQFLTNQNLLQLYGIIITCSIISPNATTNVYVHTLSVRGFKYASLDAR